MADATTMLSICDPVHMVLIRTDTAGDTTLISSYFLDWRSVLSAPSGKTSVSVELLGVGKSFSLLIHSSAVTTLSWSELWWLWRQSHNTGHELGIPSGWNTSPCRGTMHTHWQVNRWPWSCEEPRCHLILFIEHNKGISSISITDIFF